MSLCVTQAAKEDATGFRKRNSRFLCLPCVVLMQFGLRYTLWLKCHGTPKPCPLGRLCLELLAPCGNPGTAFPPPRPTLGMWVPLDAVGDCPCFSSIIRAWFGSAAYKTQQVKKQYPWSASATNTHRLGENDDGGTERAPGATSLSGTNLSSDWPKTLPGSPRGQADSRSSTLEASVQ